MRLSSATIETLAPFVPRQDLEAMQVRLRAPWRWLPAILGAGATTFAHNVAFKAGRFDETTPRGLSLIAHEAHHLTQIREMGLARFLARYLLGQLQCGFRHDSHPLEIPAIELQRKVRAALGASALPARQE